MVFNQVKLFTLNVICPLILGTFLLSCATPSSVQEDAKQQLEKRYNQKFDILSFNEISFEKPRYEMSACPHGQPEHVFQLTENKSSGIVMDNYIFSTWLYTASDELRNYLRPTFPKLAVLVEPTFAFLDSVDEKKIPTFEEALKHQQEGDEINVTVNLFRDYNDSTQNEIFDGIRKAVLFFNEKKALKVNYEFDFYDETFFKNIDTDHQHYMFQGRFFHYRDAFEVVYQRQIKYSIEFSLSLSQEADDSLLKSSIIDRGKFYKTH